MRMYILMYVLYRCHQSGSPVITAYSVADAFLAFSRFNRRLPSVLENVSSERYANITTYELNIRAFNLLLQYTLVIFGILCTFRKRPELPIRGAPFHCG